MLSDGSGNSYSYDPENRLIAVNGGSTAQYVYDAKGQRVEKVVSGAVTDFLYDTEGRTITEVNSSGSWLRGEVYAGTHHLATYYNGTTYFVHADWLGTERSRTLPNGIVAETCTSLPFGDAQTCTGTEPSTRHFTGKERDSESGLDYFGARHDASTLGRFMSVDPVIITPERKLDPQQLNRYAYVRNNPLRLVDLTGEILECTRDNKEACFSVLQQIAGDDANRLSMNAQTGVVSFDTTGLDLSGSEGATLVNQLVTSSETYGFALSDTASTAGGPVKLTNDPISNLDSRPDDRYGKGKTTTDLPPKGVADQVTINPTTAHFKDSQGRSVALPSLAFHELAEAYGKIDGGKAYGDFQNINVVNGTTLQIGPPQQGAHNEAVQREFKLRGQRPNLQNSGRAGDQLIREPHN